MKYQTIYANNMLDWMDAVSCRADTFRKIMQSGSLIEYVHTKINGSFHWHRVDGPARIFPYQFNHNLIDFYINDVHYRNTTRFCKAAGMSDEDTFMWLLRFGDDLPTTIEEFYGAGWKYMDFDEF